MLKLISIVLVLKAIDGEENVTRFADKNEFPNVGSLQNKDPVIHYCTCTLYTPEIVATVAFCVVTIDKKTGKRVITDPNGISVKFGTRYYAANVENATVSNIVEIYTHRKLEYNGKLKVFLNDAALIKIQPPVQNIKAANLALQPKDVGLLHRLIEAKQNLELVGWNLSPSTAQDADQHKVPDDLLLETKQILTVNLLSHEDCLSSICKADKKMCGLNLKAYDLMCALPLKARPGLCFAPFGSSLTYDKKLLGMGSSLTVGPKYCNENNTPILITMSHTILNVPQENIMNSSPIKHINLYIVIIAYRIALKSVHY